MPRPTSTATGLGAGKATLAARLLASMLLGAALGCTALPPEERAARQAAREQARIERSTVRVEQVAALGPYRAATLVSDDADRSFFFPSSADCDALIREGSGVRYRVHGTFGQLFDETHRCEPVGVAGLAYWRDQQGQRRSQYLIPRTLAEYRVVHQAEDHWLVRGRFPLTLELRWPEPMDAVAVLPGGEACGAVAQAGKAALEYRTQGPEAFLLEAGEAQCPIVGLALPLTLE